MAVNLTKPAKQAQFLTDACRDIQNTDCVREYTPVHNMTEEESVAKYCPAPSHAASRPTIEVLPTTASLAESNTKSNPLAYTEYTRDQRLEHLTKTFRRPNTVEARKLEKIREGLAPVLSKQKKCEIGFDIGAGATLIGLIALAGVLFYLFINIALTADSTLLPILLWSGIPASAGGGITMGISHLKAPFPLNETTPDNKLIQKLLLDPTAEVFMCNTGADTSPTKKRLKFRQHITSYIFRPYHCESDDAFRAIVRDSHDVYLIYKNGDAVLLDPLLFE